MQHPPSFAPLLGAARVVPVLTIDDVEVAVPLARALADGGISTIEVTLRTEAALRACEAISAACHDVVLGIGTILSPAQAGEAKDAGARFLVTPGTTDRLAEALLATGLACLPGSGTISEMIGLVEHGFAEMKLFPAEASGGIAMLKAVAGPLAHLKFCPTGGITEGNAAGYLALPNVLCVGGSWLAPPALVKARDWAAITGIARAATRLGMAPDQG